MDEVTAEYASSEIAPTAELRVRQKISIAAKTDIGRVRENNEDKYEFYVPCDDGTLAAKGSVFLVCDGMGGAEAGQIASELAAKTFIDVYMHHPAESARVSAEAAVKAACRYVVDVGKANPKWSGMGATLSAVILIQDQAIVVQVGDSRVYRLREGELLQATKDHTWVDEAVELGIITPKEALTHPYRHVLTRAISTEGEVNPDIFEHELLAGDLYMMCSDGLTNHVSNDEIQTTLSHEAPPEAAWKLVGHALQGGGSDNCTVLIVRVDALEEL